jgi:UDP-N-acetylmuramate dehydrogenase
MSFTIKKNVSLAEMTTLKIGGRAKFFVSAKSESEVVEAFQYAGENNLETFIIGGGSNVLIADEGFDGLVLQIALKGVSVDQKDNDSVFVKAQAGEDWDKLVAFCVEKNLQGIECLSGIPGFTGGTPVQNVGAYGQDVSETIVSVKCFDRKDQTFVELTNAECRFAYRTSVFNTSEKNRYVVTSVTFALESNTEPKIVYRDLQNYFGDRKPTLQETRRAVLEIRAAKSMVIDALDANSKSVGSFFKNPIVSVEKFAEIEERAKSLGIENVPYFKADEKNVKIPAAWLIEASGFKKGYRKRTVGLSTKHTLAIVNLGNASASDVLDLKNEIQNKVKEKFDVELKPEPVFVGFEEK